MLNTDFPLTLQREEKKTINLKQQVCSEKNIAKLAGGQHQAAGKTCPLGLSFSGNPQKASSPGGSQREKKGVRGDTLFSRGVSVVHQNRKVIQSFTTCCSSAWPLSV